MAKGTVDVILPALGMSQETGKIVQWLKQAGQYVTKSEPLVEIETDKATVEIEAPADGLLMHISASDGEEVPVGQVIAVILVPASPLAQRIADDHHLDLSQVKSTGKRIQKADVLAHLQERDVGDVGDVGGVGTQTATRGAQLLMASPKARRLAAEHGLDLAALNGSGPQGAVLAADVLAVAVASPAPAERVARVSPVTAPVESFVPSSERGESAEPTELAVSHIWRVMAERTTQSWTSTPHFSLVREVHAGQLIAWREGILKRSDEKVTYTDLLVKIVATALKKHPRVNASWQAGKVLSHAEVHVGIAVATEEGLVVPVIHLATDISLGEIARRRVELVAKAQARKLSVQDISNGTFTISNLGMYNVDAFNAIINQPQAAILAVGRIAERVVPVRGQPAVQPMMTLTLSCDHRVIDGARGAQFLDMVANFIQDPLGLLD